MARFLQLSDLHIVVEGARASGILDTRSILVRTIDRLLNMKAALGPLDAVLVSGDISDDGSADSYAFAKAELQRLGLPIFAVPGNHDAREAFRNVFSDLTETSTLSLVDWAKPINGTLVVGLDTLVEGKSGGRLQEASIEFLQNALESWNGGPVVVMLHHPPIKTGIQFMDAIGLENPQSLKSAVADVDHDILFIAGHVHSVHHGRLGNFRVATAPSICSGFGLDLRTDAEIGFLNGPTGCVVIDTGPNGIWSTVPLESFDGPYPF